MNGKTLFEGRLDNAVDAGAIGIGETVDIRNKMGESVYTGDVVASTPLGLSFNDGNFYDRDLYIFVPIVEAPHVVSNQLLSSPDDRVEYKMRIGEAEKLDKANSGDEKKDPEDDGDDSGKDSEIGKKTKPKKNDDEDNAPLANTDSAVDVNSLPEDIRKAVISTVQMNEDQMQSVLSDIGDAAIKALKRVNIKEQEIYLAVSEIQNASEEIFKKPLPKNKPRKS